MDKCKEHEATVRDFIAMASNNSQLQTAYQQGTANVDEKTFRRKQHRHTQQNNSENRSGSRERYKKHPKQKSKSKRCGFEKQMGNVQLYVDFATSQDIMRQLASLSAHRRRETQDKAQEEDRTAEAPIGNKEMVLVEEDQH